MRTLLLTLVLGTATLAHHHAADACANETFYTLDNATSDLARAEEHLDKGRYARALRGANATHVESAMPSDPRSYSPEQTAENAEARRPGLVARKQRVIAIAELRLGKAKQAKPKLAALVKRSPDDPALKTRYAEALIATGDKAGGSAILVDLETRDLMPDAAGWIALAKLRDTAGEVEARDRAVTSCKAMATNAKDCTFAMKVKAKAKSPAKTAAK